MTDTDPRAQVDSLRDQLQNGDRGGSDADREALLQASDHIFLVPSKISDHRHIKLLRHCTRMSEEVDGVSLVDVLEDRDAAEQLVRWIHSNYENEHTNQDYRTALRSFGRYHDQLEEPPDALAWIPTGTSNDFDPVPSERDLLKYGGDVRPMIDAARYVRDEALIALQFEAGLRGGELYDLRVGDVFESEHTTGIHVDGKEGERAVHLVVSVPFLQQWLDRHPAGDDDQAHMWTKLESTDQPTYSGFLKMFRTAAEEAAVSKEVTPTNFRKSNTRWLVLLGFSQPRIEERQGRKRGSEHTARYMARFGEESNEAAYAQLHGLDVETDEEGVVGAIICKRCQRETPGDRDFCMWCHFGLTHDAADQVGDVDQAHVESGAQATGQVAEDVVELDRARRQSPAITRVMTDTDE